MYLPFYILAILVICSLIRFSWARTKVTFGCSPPPVVVIEFDRFFASLMAIKGNPFSYVPVLRESLENCKCPLGCLHTTFPASTYAIILEWLAIFISVIVLKLLAIIGMPKIGQAPDIENRHTLRDALLQRRFHLAFRGLFNPSVLSNSLV